MSEAGEATYRFLSGAAMQPEAVLAAYPGAQFVARARLEGRDTGEGDTWGIVIRTEASPAAGDELHDVTTDDGRTLAARISDGGRPTGDPAAILAAAKYRELPPAYVQRMSS